MTDWRAAAACLPHQTCSVDGCERGGTITRGFCRACYERRRRRGELEPLHSPAERLTAGLERKPNGCLEWTGYTNETGYGKISVNGKLIRTHHLAWTLANGPIPDGLWVLHHCDNPPCVETAPTEGYPDGHLFLGTSADNHADMDSKGRNHNQRKTHCPQNHPYAGDNLRIGAKGERVCRTCASVADAKRRPR